MSGEFAFIEWVRAQIKSHPRVSLGIGDDAAALRFPEPSECLIAVDTLMEGVHFTTSDMTPAEIGRKCLGVNLSDIAAMAGQPLAAVVGIVFPRNQGQGFAQEFERGLLELAEQFETALIGGDTNTWDGPCVVSVTVLGEAVGAGVVRRDGAQVGDWIFATGQFGGSLLGHHYQFTPRIKEALLLHNTVDLHAMIDVSDGLAGDLFHILDESQVGAVLEAEQIPIHDAAHNFRDARTPLEHALGDGEDFELLFTVSPSDGTKLVEQSPLEIPLTKIGEIVELGRRVILDAQGKVQPLQQAGWVHQF